MLTYIWIILNMWTWIRYIKKTSNEHDEKMKEIESKINDSKDELEIK